MIFLILLVFSRSFYFFFFFWEDWKKSGAIHITFSSQPPFMLPSRSFAPDSADLLMDAGNAVYLYTISLYS
jgi:hypothetical protein